MLDAWRSGRFVTYPELPDWGQPAVVAAAHAGLARSSVGVPLAEVVARQWVTTTERAARRPRGVSTPTGGASPATTGSSPTRRPRSPSVCEHLGAGMGRRPGRPAPATPATPSTRRTRRSGGATRGARAGLGPRAPRRRCGPTGVFANPPRIRPVGPGPGPTPARRAPGRSADGARVATAPRAPPSRCEACTPTSIGRPAPRARQLAARVDLPERPGHRRAARRRPGQHPLPDLPQPDGHGPQPATCWPSAPTGRLGVPEPAGRRRTSSSPRAATTPATCPAPSHVTGDIRIHEIAFVGGELWIVNTRFSCLATLDGVHSFVPRWRPPFITALAAEDRCHLNGMAVIDGEAATSPPSAPPTRPAGGGRTRRRWCR